MDTLRVTTMRVTTETRLRIALRGHPSGHHLTGDPRGRPAGAHLPILFCCDVTGLSDSVFAQVAESEGRCGVGDHVGVSAEHDVGTIRGDFEAGSRCETTIGDGRGDPSFHLAASGRSAHRG